MINAALDFIVFFKSNFSMLFALIVYTILAIALSKSIKKNYKVYYWIFGILSVAFVIPFTFRILGMPLSVNLGKIPFFGPCINELSSAGNFVHPILIIIMYMGAFSPKNQYIGRLMSIRKELSIIVGFPVIAHALKRIFASFPDGWKYFANHEEFMQSPRVTSALGSGITSFVFVLGLVMTILFLVLWITSFDSVHRKLGTQRWKSVQKWSYGLYAMLFIHAMGLSLGGYISDKARAEQQQASRPAQTEMVAEKKGERPQRAEGQQAQQGHGQQQGHGAPQQAQAQQGGHGKKPQPFKFEEIEISRGDKRIINMFIYVLIYGSYLYFRLRKAKLAKQKRQQFAQ
ncbi:MAG: hypothetical protein SNH01_04805 [Rikenellaceae bacterium]